MEIDLLQNYPKTKRNLEERAQTKSEEDRQVARQFGQEFFDGDRRHGYGGYQYNPRFWQPVVPTFQQHYQITKGDRILDVGCGKGFMLYDFMQLIPGVEVAGVDISNYAIQHAVEDVKPFLRVANAKLLPYPDDYFDVVISINTIHNLELEECIKALEEMQRVGRKHKFLTVDAYRTDQEKERMYAWNLTAKTILHVDEWISLFKRVGYTGDYNWFIP